MVGAQRTAARRSNPTSRGAWVRQHRASINDTLANLRNSRGAIALSVLVIGITLTLPLGLYVLQKNFVNVIAHLGSQPQATLFLESAATLADAEALASLLRSDPRLGGVQIIDKKAALQEIGRSSSMAEVIDTLPENPLPFTLIVGVDAVQFEGPAGQRLQRELEQAPKVETAQFDITWMRRLEAVSDLASRMAVVFAVFLGAGVILITGNTIRGGIHTHRDEIEVAKLCGATDAYIHRPFLYSGAVQGFLGATVALALVTGAIAALGAPTETLAALYDSDMQLLNVSALSIISVLGIGASLGWIGSWVAVTVYLKRMDVARHD